MARAGLDRLYEHVRAGGQIASVHAGGRADTPVRALERCSREASKWTGRPDRQPRPGAAAASRRPWATCWPVMARSPGSWTGMTPGPGTGLWIWPACCSTGTGCGCAAPLRQSRAVSGSSAALPRSVARARLRCVISYAAIARLGLSALRRDQPQGGCGTRSPGGCWTLTRPVGLPREVRMKGNRQGRAYQGTAVVGTGLPVVGDDPSPCRCIWCRTVRSGVRARPGSAVAGVGMTEVGKAR